MRESTVRIDGWKAIAAHFRRDRTTVMRWARDRDLPIKRVPGGGTGSVYAYAGELDQWLATARGIDVAGEPTIAIVNRPLRAFAIGIAALLGASAVAYALVEPVKPVAAISTHTLPDDPAIAAIYLEARDNWALRTADGLHRAVAGFGEVVSRDPDFAPAYAGLADAYLLVREFDALPDATAYGRAESAAKAALAIDPQSAAAHRALGFSAYWWQRENAAARDHFGHALALDPKSAQTHFWLGNALVDNGEAKAGLQQLDIARLLDPGSPAIKADYAWALWSAGQRDAAKHALDALAAANPKSSSPQTYLAYIHFAERNFAAYLAASEKRALLRADPQTIARNKAERAAFARGGDRALLAVMAQQAGDDLKSGAVRDASWAAVIAAQAGDRGGLIALLERADARDERWGLGGLVLTVFGKWKNDPAVTRLADARRGPSLAQN